MKSLIAFLIRVSIWVSSMRGEHWYLLKRDWHDVIDAQIDNVFEKAE